MPVESAVFDFDEAHATLDESACEQHTLTESAGAVEHMGCLAFLAEIKGFEVLRLHQLDGGLECLAVVAHMLLAFGVFLIELLVELLAEIELFVKLFLIRVLCRFAVLQACHGIADRKWTVFGLHKSGTWVTATAVHGDVVGDLFAGFAHQLVGPRAWCRVYDARTWGIAGAHEIPSLCVGALSGCHRADQGDLIHLLGEVGQAVTELDAVDIGADGFGASKDFRAGA